MIKAKRGWEILLVSGRRVYLDQLVLESETAQIDVTKLSEAEVPLLIKRRNTDSGEYFWGGTESSWRDPDPFHYMLPHPWPDDQDPIERVLLSVLLWSDPIREGFTFSELMVVLLVEWKEILDLAQFLQKTLSSVDWNGLAVDRCRRKPIPRAVGGGFSPGSVNEVYTGQFWRRIVFFRKRATNFH